MTRISVRQLTSNTGPFGRGAQVVRPEGVPEGSVVTVMRVPPECAGMRLDRFVQTQLKRTSRTRTQKILALGCFSPDARPLRANDRVKAEQAILLWRAPWDEKAPDVAVPIIYEDEHLLAVNKPPGIPVHPTARYHASTVVKLLEAARPGDHLRLSHRIDRETSGALLLARTAEADRLVKIQFEERQTVDKHYLAITWGWPEEDRFRVELPLEIDPDSKLKVKMRIARPGHGLPSRTGCEVLGRRTHPLTGRRYALIRCHLETGRQHQIRLHLASLGFVLVGEKLYGADEGFFTRGADGVLTEKDRAALELERHALHAERLELDHPITGERITLVAPLPEDLQRFWDGLAAGHLAEPG
jgi:23S rRNA pseudouridine1911/1915/1917 synthase